MTTGDHLVLARWLLPEMLLVATALVVLAVDLLVMRQEPLRLRFMLAAGLASAGCAAGLLWLPEAGPPMRWMDGMLVWDPAVRLVKAALLILAACAVWLAVDSRFTEHAGEYVALVLLGTVGMLFLCGTEDLLLVFVALELTSLSLYLLAGFDKRSARSAEAALKYFLFGASAAAFTLFGLSLLYGVGGGTGFRQAAAVAAAHARDPLLWVALAMTVTGFGFKVAAVPFHLWAPDAYQGAPTPAAAWIASGSKLAGFFVFGKVMILAFAGLEGQGAWRHFEAGWVPLVAGLAVLSMLLGNLTAIAQTNVKRLLAYSAVAHAGYALLGIVADGAQGFVALLYYTLTYAPTVLGAFGVIAVVERENGRANLEDLAGLSRRAPFLALCLMVFLLSLAGIPPLAGFFGKLYLFVAVTASAGPRLGLLWLAIVAIALSTVSLYYYLQVLKQAYVLAPPVDAPPIRCPMSTTAVLALLALSVVLFGCAPDFILARLDLVVRAVAR